HLHDSTTSPAAAHDPALGATSRSPHPQQPKRPHHAPSPQGSSSSVVQQHQAYYTSDPGAGPATPKATPVTSIIHDQNLQLSDSMENTPVPSDSTSQQMERVKTPSRVPSPPENLQNATSSSRGNNSTCQSPNQHQHQATRPGEVAPAAHQTTQSRRSSPLAVPADLDQPQYNLRPVPEAD
ncbi:unnamed protein product, partial [Amoebophrya sp. A120]